MSDAGGPDSLASQVSAFERFVQQQTAAPAEAYDLSYFGEKWRAGHQDSYSLDDRRRIEGRNPALIAEVFAPSRALDMGCGPGALMCLLEEQGVVADGVDFAEASREMAPEHVRPRITIGSVVDVALPDQSYDLVICREVLEHLTVLDVHRAVGNMCRIASKYIYVTTRFHPNPETLFDVTTEFEVDPTHITLLNIHFLRLFFVLNGFRRRPDLEGRMDWLNKGRVLVYERP